MSLRDESIVLQLYKLFRPHLKYSVHAGMDTILLSEAEGIQRRATSLISSIMTIKDKTYEDSYSKLTTLETRRYRGDQIEVFRII